MLLLTASSITMLILSIVNVVCWRDPSFHQYGYIVSFLLVLNAFCLFPMFSRVYLKLGKANDLLQILGEAEILSALKKEARKLNEAIHEERRILLSLDFLHDERPQELDAAQNKVIRLRRRFLMAYSTAEEICTNIKNMQSRDFLQ